MPTTSASPVEEYIRSQPPKVQRALRSVRRALRKALPGAEEVISYKMPAFKLHGRVLLYFAGWSEHCALYPGSRSVLMEFKEELRPYELLRGTIRFPLSQPVPVKLIERIAQFRAREAANPAKQKKPAP